MIFHFTASRLNAIHFNVKLTNPQKECQLNRKREKLQKILVKYPECCV